jgi:hypothetical protein
MPLLNVFDAAPGRTVAVIEGDLFEEAIQVDLLVISAWENYYEGEPGSMVATLQERCGLSVKTLQRTPALDLRMVDTIRAWITPALNHLVTPPRWPDRSATRFTRLAVVESPRQPPADTSEQMVFQQLFCLLSLLPLHGIPCRSVATPLLNTGRQKALPQQLYPAMLSAVAGGFRHLPELRQLVIFDRKTEPLKQLCEAIDQRLNRTPLDLQPLVFKPHQRTQLSSLVATIQQFCLRFPELLEANPDMRNSLATIHQQLEGGSVVAVTLGVAARMLLEALVGQALVGRGIPRTLIPDNLFDRIRRLRVQLDPWMESDLNTIRCFGNWMAHATPLSVGDTIPRRPVTLNDLLSMLLALERVLCQYPWPTRLTTALAAVAKDQVPGA